MNEDLYNEIAEVAKRRVLITYGEIARTVNLDMSNDADREQMSRMLAEIASHEQQAGRPMLTAVVVHQGGDNNPGEGFFAIATEFGRFAGGHNQLRRLVFWVREVAAVHDHWGQ